MRHFDPTRRVVIYTHDTTTDVGTATYQQGPRIFVPTAEGQVYMLFNTCVAKIDPPLSATPFRITKLANSPISLDAGGDYADGRVYFANGSHLCSFQVK